MTGNIDIAKCSCVQNAGGRCCHVSALLFFIDDLKTGRVPHMKVSVTSQPQAWGKGMYSYKVLIYNIFLIAYSEVLAKIEVDLS